MGNLREKKKENRKQRIQNAAVELFGTIGFEAATISNIAEMSDLGVGTFYNYYKSKDEVLLSIISDKSDQARAKFDLAINESSYNILDSINVFIDIYFESFLTYNKLIWREFISNVFGKQQHIIKSIMGIDLLFTDKLREMFRHCIDKDIINAGVDESSAANAIYSIMIFQVMLYLLDEDMKVDTARLNINTQLKVIINGLD